MSDNNLERAIKLQRAWSGLAAGKRTAQAELEAHWRQRRSDVKEALHEAIRDLFRGGLSVPQVSNLVSNTNYSLLYKLKSDANSGVPSRVTTSVSLQDLEDEIEELPEVEWEYHEHIGVHGWLLDSERQFAKFYGQKGTTHEGDWVIVNIEGGGRGFIAGSMELNNAMSPTEFDKKLRMLTDLLDGGYMGPTRIVDNPYKD